jgi:ketosteroid isomerase-like protein
VGVTENRRTVERYMEGFNSGDHDVTAACLTDDAEWLLPGGFHLMGRTAFRAEAEKVGPGSVAVTVSRVVEADDVVVAEGTVRSKADDGATVNLAFCDVFELRDGKIRRLTSYVVPLT